MVNARFTGELMSITNAILCVGSCLVLVSCQDLNQPLPAGTIDPNSYKTPNRALSAYRGALNYTINGMGLYALNSAQFTDEIETLDASQLALYAGTVPPLLDTRNIASQSDGGGSFVLYQRLQAIRSNADQALGLLQMFPNEFPKTFQAELYVSKALSIVLLGEFFCSGVPLSTVDFDKDFTYRPGSSSSELFTKAIQLFDSATALGIDSSGLVQLANVGAARALLNLGRFDEAAARVTDIEVGFTYGLPLTGTLVEGSLTGSASNSMSDREGGNGMPFRSSNDPRSSFRAAVYTGKAVFIRTNTSYRGRMRSCPLPLTLRLG